MTTNDLKQLHYQIRDEAEETMPIENQPSFLRTSYITGLVIILLLLFISSFFLYRKYKKAKVIKKITSPFPPEI